MRRIGLLLIAVLFFPAVGTATIPSSERDALIAFYNETGGPSWTNRTNWLGAPGTECTWFGVRCGPMNVTSLLLPNNNVSGAFPGSIVINGFPNLVELNLGGNQLTGTIPADISRLNNLQLLYLYRNKLTGEIPASLGSIPSLRLVSLYSNQLTGPIPTGLSNLSNLEVLSISFNQLSGPIPANLASLTNLRYLYLGSNQLTGPIPDLGTLTRLEGLSISGADGLAFPSWVATLTSLRFLYFYSNGFSGSFPNLSSLTNLEELEIDGNLFDPGPMPASLFSFSKLQVLWIADNNFSGPIPDAVGNLRALVSLDLSSNSLTGSIPAPLITLPSLTYLYLTNNMLSGGIPREIGQMTGLQDLFLNGNDFTGEIPPEIGNLRNLVGLTLARNRLTGAIPREIGQLTNLQFLVLSRNNLVGRIPDEIANLTNLREGTAAGAGLAYNGLFTDNPAVYEFLNRKSAGDVLDGRWDFTQTIPPTSLRVVATTPTEAQLNWNPIVYRNHTGGYQIGVSKTPGGPYAVALTTTDKTVGNATISNLDPSTQYSFAIRTITYPHYTPYQYFPLNQKNTVISGFSAEVTATTNPRALTPPQVVLAAIPSLMVQTIGASPASTSLTLFNAGEVATSISLNPQGNFFTITPTLFTLEPGASQTINVSATPQSEPGLKEGKIVPSGVGVAPDFTIDVRLFVSAPPAGIVVAAPLANRVDVSAPPEEIRPTGTAVFVNKGSTRLVGVLTSDVPWIIPQSEPKIITIEPGQSVTVHFTIDRTLRPDADALLGSQVGNLTLVFSSAPSGKAFSKRPLNGASVTVGSTVTVVDTAKPPVSATSLPPREAGEVAFFLSGVGHVTGSVGTFLSDVAIINTSGTASLNGVKLYYTPAVSSPTTLVTSLSQIKANQPLALGDIVKSVFNGNEQSGTLQVRTKQPDSIALNATVINATNPKGTYGAAIPVFRSDRDVAPNQKLYLTGLRVGPRNHTNLVLQETLGGTTNIQIEFLDGAGRSVGQRTESVAGGQLLRMNSVAPEGAVSAILTNLATSAGRFLAFATPVDRAPGGGDTWAVVDWAQHFVYARNEPVIVPVAGSRRGANNTFFRTDFAVMNTGSLPASGTARFYSESGATIDKTIDLSGLQTASYDDVMTSLFGAASGSLGYIVLTPTQGAFAVTSRTYATVGSDEATFGTAVPAMAIAGSLRLGQTRRIGGVEDASIATIIAQKPATFRTNFGMVETDGKRVRVRVTLHYSYSAGTVAARGLASRDYELNPNGFKLEQNIAEKILGDARARFGDLRNLQVDFTVVEGEGAVTVFTSSIDNGTGDQVLRVE